jgi:hypothetical protein
MDPGDSSETRARHLGKCHFRTFLPNRLARFGRRTDLREEFRQDWHDNLPAVPTADQPHYVIAMRVQLKEVHRWLRDVQLSATQVVLQAGKPPATQAVTLAVEVATSVALTSCNST